MLLLRHNLLCFIVGCAVVSSPPGLALPQQVKQTPEVIEAYRVCRSFEQLLGEDLDFARAYQFTFTKDRARRRAIAIADGEFGNQAFAHIDDQLLIKAYKLRMQIFYLVLPLASPSDEEERLFFPSDIIEIFQRTAPTDSRNFRSYVAQLERDVVRFRSHLERLTADSPAVAGRVSKFKAEARSAKFEPPSDYNIEPRHGYYRDGVLGKEDGAYYEINGYIVTQEQGQMRLVGIRFFNRLF